MIISQLLIMLRSILYITYRIYVRFCLLMLSMLEYQMFLIVEVFLHTYEVTYPSYLKKYVESLYDFYMWIAVGFLEWLAVKTAMLSSFVRWIIRILIASLGILIAPITYLVNLRRNKKCPPPTDPILFKTATQITEMIRNKKIKCEDVVKAYVDRIKEVNSVLNAVVEPRYEVALIEARNIDKLLATTEKTPEQLAEEYPLLGIPITVKESLAVEGMSNDAGCVRNLRIPATKDAEAVALARAAGAIPMAVTNTPQLCMNWETYNKVTGLTRNPYSSKRTAGGSSGGEAALLGSGASIVGLGSDIAGSLRLPSMFCGVYGHKPTPRTVSTIGHYPGCPNPIWDDFFAVGPMTRYADDLPLMLRVLSGENVGRLQLDKEVDIRKIRYFYMESDGCEVMTPIDSDVREAISKVRAHFMSQYKIDVKKLKIKQFEHMWEISSRILVGIDNVENIYTCPDKPNEWKSVWPEVMKKTFGMSQSQFTCVAYGPLKKFFDILPQRQLQLILNLKEQLQEELTNILGEDGVLIYPTFPSTAHIHYQIFYKFLNFGYLTVFNVFGLPVTNCPLGLTANGMPVGLQLVSNKNNDRLTLAVAKELERTFGGWVPPNTHERNCV